MKVSIDTETLFRILRLLFLFSLTFVFVYFYFLYTKGKLLSTILSFWNAHQTSIIAFVGFCLYTFISLSNWAESGERTLNERF